jgi:hypothetical protein
MLLPRPNDRSTKSIGAALVSAPATRVSGDDSPHTRPASSTGRPSSSS